MACTISALAAGFLVPSAARYEAPASTDLLALLGQVDDALAQGAADEMQRLFPEGAFFLHALDGLAWVELADQPTLRAKALAAASQALVALEDPAITARFSPNADPPLGVFHAGWSAWLAVRLAERGVVVPSLDARLTALALAIERAPAPFLPAYEGLAWPCDTVVAVAALARAQRRLGKEEFSPIVQAWLERARTHVEPVSQLFPHRADPATGAALEGPRGSSQAIILRFLPEIDPGLARAHYARARHLFVDDVGGLVGVREHPENVRGAGDVDSGPLLFGLSGSASVVFAGAARVAGDLRLSRAIVQEAEAVGLAFTWNGRRRLLFGALPVAEAFLAWSLAAPLGAPEIGFDALPFPWLVVVAVGGAWLPIVAIWYRRRSRTVS